MEKIAFKMKLKSGFKGEYKKRHDEIWPELAKLLKENGVSDYSIFFDDETDILFAVQKLSSETSAQNLSGDAVMKKWWDYMADVMDVNPDNSPVVVKLEKVFHLE
jgi:L-rhamnose mutarotase